MLRQQILQYGYVMYYACPTSSACIIYASPAIFRLYSVCAHGQYRTTSLLGTSTGRSWQHRYGQDISFYSGSTRSKHVGGMPLEVDFTHAYVLCTLDVIHVTLWTRLSPPFLAGQRSYVGRAWGRGYTLRCYAA